MTGIAGCCASAANGHATAPPPIVPINSRRLMGSSLDRRQYSTTSLSRVVHHSKTGPLMAAKGH